MNWKSNITKIAASAIISSEKKWIQKPVATQQKVFKSLLKKAANTSFGKDHKFSTIKSYKEFKKLVPIQDYEGLRPYVERAVA
ncbi:MAG: GH3 auxin-responsive promoter family protein, partial [Cyclobacteriaceae bacterium]